MRYSYRIGLCISKDSLHAAKADQLGDEKMSSIMNPNNKVMRALARLADLMLLNLLTILCALPIVTAGASLTAMNSVMWHMVRDEEGYTAKSFFRAFRENLKQGVLIGILYEAVLLVLVLELFMVQKTSTSVPGFIPAMLIIGIVLVSAVALWSFILLSRYNNTVRGTLKSAALATVGFAPQTFLMLIVIAACIFLLAAFFRLLAPIALLVGISGPGYLCAKIYDKAFEKLEKKDV